MKKSLLPIALLLLAAGPRTLQAENNFSLTLGGQASLRLSGVMAYDNSYGGSLLVETQTGHFSLGIGFSAHDYLGAASLNPNWASSVDLFGRFLPWGLAEGWSPYLIGGVGINPKLFSLSWPGDYHGFAGLGAWCSLGPNLALDFAALYDIYTPLDAPLQNVGLRAGLTFFFEPIHNSPEGDSMWVKSTEVKPTQKAEPSPALEPTPEPTPQVTPTPAVHQVKSHKKVRKIKASSLWDLAARADVYGDPELYPALVDANIENLANPGAVGSIPLAPGKKLVIPRHLTEEQSRIARENAWKPNYIRWRGKDIVKEEYLKTKMTGTRD